MKGSWRDIYLITAGALYARHFFFVVLKKTKFYFPALTNRKLRLFSSAMQLALSACFFRGPSWLTKQWGEAVTGHLWQLFEPDEPRIWRIHTHLIMKGQLCRREKISSVWTSFDPFFVTVCLQVQRDNQLWYPWTKSQINPRKMTVTIFCLKKRLWTKLLKCTTQITLFLFLLPLDLIESYILKWHCKHNKAHLC